jgi:hypothetical protein
MMNEDIIDQDLVVQKHKPVFRKRILFLWVLVVVLAVLFRIMHWPGGSILFVISTAGLHAYGVVGFRKSKRKRFLIGVLNILGLFWSAFLLKEFLDRDSFAILSSGGFGIYCLVLLVFITIYTVQFNRMMRK